MHVRTPVRPSHHRNERIEPLPNDILALIRKELERVRYRRVPVAVNKAWAGAFRIRVRIPGTKVHKNKKGRKTYKWTRNMQVSYMAAASFARHAVFEIVKAEDLDYICQWIQRAQDTQDLDASLSIRINMGPQVNRMSQKCLRNLQADYMTANWSVLKRLELVQRTLMPELRDFFIDKCPFLEYCVWIVPRWYYSDLERPSMDLLAAKADEQPEGQAVLAH